jgi:hypothetical protein
MPNNNVNTVTLEEGKIVKRGPVMRGEVYFYKSLSALPSIVKFFPEFFGSDEKSITIEYLPGLPLTLVFDQYCMEAYHIDLLFKALNSIHTCCDIPIESLPTDILHRHYLGKLTKRFSDAVYLDISGVAQTQNLILQKLGEYISSSPTICPVIHGDCWFANILVSDTIKFIDMRGQLGDILTTAGDPVYDYAKLAQSFLGFDTIVFNLSAVAHSYRVSLLKTFTKHLREISPTLPPKVLTVAISLMAGVLPFYDSKRIRKGIWNLVNELLEPTLPNMKDLIGAFT